jgi:cytochrome c1
MSDVPVRTQRIKLLGGVMAIGLMFAVFLAANEISMWRADMDVATALADGQALRAPPIFRRYGCTGCHTIPGIPGADGQVGGPLAGLSKRVYIAGVLPNASENLVGWIVSPQRYSPHTAMPATGISDAEARDLVAYLYSH